ncbi:MAG: hypothetical protein COY80_01935 [Candidatus Pacebacteria bacterium CG_4_10_14_0_8_um_filter_42_14]|nr:MAG: hypothetical protein COY80_01935 [Candidatus Pacebacteria bacterium CG_4_10_14_0_8_um_filter_42_14]
MSAPFIRAELFLNDGTIQHLSSRKSRRIFHFIQTANEQEVDYFFIRVTYSLSNLDKAIFQNEGEYKSKSQAIETLKQFLEKP